jgi:AcrR family transcriptional regulator
VTRTSKRPAKATPKRGARTGGPRTTSGGTTKQAAADARRAALLKHARAEIAKHGVHGASLNEIARRAGGSKATIVKLFGNKQGLFSAVLGDTLDGFLGDLEAAVRAEPGASLEATLTALGRRLLRLYLMPEALATYRLLVSAGRAPSELTRTFYEAGHLRVVAAVAALLEPWRGRGIDASVDLAAEAGRFTHLLRSGLYERALLGLAKARASDPAIEAIARESARVLVRGIGSTPAARSIE